MATAVAAGQPFGKSLSSIYPRSGVEVGEVLPCPAVAEALAPVEWAEVKPWAWLGVAEARGAQIQRAHLHACPCPGENGG